MSIPKKIHYCWLSNEKMPENILLSIESWKKAMPDYELIIWDKTKIDIDLVPWVAEAYRQKKYATAADYIRLYAIYTEGGIYLDTDVYVFKPFDDFLQYDFFTNLEYEGNTDIFENVVNSDLDNIHRVEDITLNAAIFGGVKGHPFLKDCLDWYENHHYSSKYYTIIAPDIYAAIAQKYGFKYLYRAQKLQNNMIILPAIVFTHRDLGISKNSYALHWWAGSWRNESKITLLGQLRKNNILRRILGKKPILTIDKIVKQQLERVEKNEFAPREKIEVVRI